MSIEKSAYTVLGYDISEYQKEILTDEFIWSDLYEEITNGKIRLFTDDNGEFMYFGYLLFCSNEYSEEAPDTLEIKEIERAVEAVNAVWCKYGEVFANIDRERLQFKIICFEEYS